MRASYTCTLRSGNAKKTTLKPFTKKRTHILLSRKGKKKSLRERKKARGKIVWGEVIPADCQKENPNRCMSNMKKKPCRGGKKTLRMMGIPRTGS